MVVSVSAGVLEFDPASPNEATAMVKTAANNARFMDGPIVAPYWNGPMQKYDVTLKLLLQGHASLTMIELAGATVEKWLNVELPKVQNPRADLLGETADGG